MAMMSTHQSHASLYYSILILYLEVLLLFCVRILKAKQTIRRFILLNRRKTPNRRIKTVIRIIIITHGNLSNQNIPSPRLHIKIMILMPVPAGT